MADPNLELLRLAAVKMGDLVDDVVFVGGCVVGLLVTDAAAAEIRPTDDVDVIIEVVGYGRYQHLIDRLRGKGFREDTSDNAPVCRYVHSGTVLDFMPADDSVLGFANPWYPKAIETVSKLDIGLGRMINVISAACFAATKIVAFHDRGKGDFLGGHDLEDLVTLLDGRPEFLEEFNSADTALRSFLSEEFRKFLEDPRFLDAIPGHIGNESASQARIPMLLSLLHEIAGNA
jgi:hypothetical protein